MAKEKQYPSGSITIKREARLVQEQRVGPPLLRTDATFLLETSSEERDGFQRNMGFCSFIVNIAEKATIPGRGGSEPIHPSGSFCRAGEGIRRGRIAWHSPRINWTATARGPSDGFSYFGIPTSEKTQPKQLTANTPSLRTRCTHLDCQRCKRPPCRGKKYRHPIPGRQIRPPPITAAPFPARLQKFEPRSHVCAKSHFLPAERSRFSGDGTAPPPHLFQCCVPRNSFRAAR